MYGETLFPMLDVFIKGYFDNTNLNESEICVNASYIINIFNQFFHYINIYIYKKTGISIYKKSFDLCQHKDIGEYFEIYLFGKVIDQLNKSQALYILDEKNYDKNCGVFKDEYLKCENIEDFKKINENLEKVKPLLKGLDIYTTINDTQAPSTYFNIKVKNKIFVTRLNKDKRGRPVDTNELFKDTPFEFLINKK